MSLRGTTTVLAVVALLAGAPVVAAVAAGGGPPLGGGPSETTGPHPRTAPDPPGVAPRPVEPDRILIRIRVHQDGSATWAIEHRMVLDDESDREGFERAREAVGSNRSNLTREFRRRARGLASEAGRATDRTMVVENVSVTARESVAGDQGIVTYRFRWYGFARTGDRLVIGDAMTGLIIDEKTTLQVSWPAEASAESVSPDPDERRERSATWTGPRNFAPGEPRIVVTSEELAFGTTGGVPGGGYGSPLPVLALLLGAILVVGIGGIYLVRSGTSSSGEATPGADEGATGEEPSGASSGPETEDGTGDEPGPDVAPEPEHGARDTTQSGATDDTARASDPPDGDADIVGDDGTTGTGGADAAASSGSGATGTGDTVEDEVGDVGSGDTPGGPTTQPGAGSEGERVQPGEGSDGAGEPPPSELLSNEEQVLQLLENRGGRTKQQDVVDTLGWSETKTSEVVNEMREADAIEVYRLGRENVLALPGESGFDIGGDDE